MSIIQSYRNLPPKHKLLLWILISAALWGQILIIIWGIVTLASPGAAGTTVLRFYQSLPSKHRVYFWVLVFITLWSQVIIIAGGWLRKNIKKENILLKEKISFLEQNNGIDSLKENGDR